MYIWRHSLRVGIRTDGKTRHETPELYSGFFEGLSTDGLELLHDAVRERMPRERGDGLGHVHRCNALPHGSHLLLAWGLLDMGDGVTGAGARH